MTLTKLQDNTAPSLGCDPEFFFTYKEKIIGSELIIPENGENIPVSYNPSKIPFRIIRDGVQAEINIPSNTCRDIVAGNISTTFSHIKNEVIKKNTIKDLNVSFKQLVKVTKPQMKKLSEASRKFGCSPSKSIYGEAIDISSINTDEYRYRAAGGHIHLGTNGAMKGSGLYKALKEDVERTVVMLDIICGNTLVLVDRDKGNIERRKVYGRAGEYRTPEHGIEYRTPSNFWLHCKPLMSLTFGLARLAVALMADLKNNETYYKAFTDAVSMQDIQSAINNNDYKLALSNFKKIEPLLLQVVGDGQYGRYPINSSNIKKFYKFVKNVKTIGLTYYFPTNPLDHWSMRSDSMYYCGFNDFLSKKV